MKVKNTQRPFKQDEQEGDGDCSHKDSEDEGTYDFVSEFSYDSCSDHTSVVPDPYIDHIAYVSLVDHDFHK